MAIDRGNVKAAPLPCCCCSIAHPYHAQSDERSPRQSCCQKRWHTSSSVRQGSHLAVHACSPTVMPPWMQRERNGLWTASHAFSIYHTAISCRQLEKDLHVHEHAWLEAAAVQLLIYHVFSFSDTWLATLARARKTGWEEEMAGGWQLFQALYFNWLWICLNNLNLADAYCSSEEDIEHWREQGLRQVEDLREKI